MRYAVLLLALGACLGAGDSLDLGNGTNWSECCEFDDDLFPPTIIWITVPTTEETYVTDLASVEVAGEYTSFIVPPIGLTVRNTLTGAEHQVDLEDGLWWSKEAVALDLGANRIEAWLGTTRAAVTVVRTE